MSLAPVQFCLKTLPPRVVKDTVSIATGSQVRFLPPSSYFLATNLFFVGGNVFFHRKHCRYKTKETVFYRCFTGCESKGIFH